VDALWSGSIDGWQEEVPRARRVRRRAPSAPDPVVRREPPLDPVHPPERAPLPVEVVRSAKRRKSVSARIVDGRIVVRMPQWMSAAQEAEYVASLTAKLERQRGATAVDLPQRAALLAGRYELPEPSSIRFVSNQAHRWGSCTPSSGEIRISDRIAGFPDWVLDAVIVHELAHLVHRHHGPEFWALANRYPKTERAYGFLIAKQLTEDDLEAD
jgi:predicted metal-dependent hydrolase